MIENKPFLIEFRTKKNIKEDKPEEAAKAQHSVGLICIIELISDTLYCFLYFH